MIRVGNTSKWALALASCSVAAILAVGCPAKAQTCPAPDFGTTGLVGGSLLRMVLNGAEHDEDETED
jgi:hypothetical protein